TKRNEIAAALNRSRLPAVYAIREFAAAGGLIVHGANLGVLFERAAGYVDRILKGAKPADLPVQLATEFELIINLKAAAAIGVTIPPTFIARADEAIERSQQSSGPTSSRFPAARRARGRVRRARSSRRCR